jgi:phenylpropionate dioxygenase-like ring-hydroxylating dioxygenase large terminal subunit
MELPDRVPKKRYFDADFYQLEAEQLWPRVWQMACRLEEIPEPHDFAEYEILDQSIVVVRTDEMGVIAFQNACRHRGVSRQGRGMQAGFACPFHGWCYPDSRTPWSRSGGVRRDNLQPEDLDLRRCERGVGGCAWINLDDDAPPLRTCIEPAASILDEWKVESLRTEWWYACRLPVNWKLAEQAFQEQYHVVEAHPQLVIPDGTGRDGRNDPRPSSTRRSVPAAMARAWPAWCTNDVRIAEACETWSLPIRPGDATWHHLNSAVVRSHGRRARPA